MASGENAIEVHDITKTFGSIMAVDHVSFEVARGEIFGFLGPNGAGKTTLIRILTTLLKPTSGGSKVGDIDVARYPDKVKRKIGVIPQAMTSDLDLTGYENMDIYGRFYGIPSQERKRRIQNLIDRIGLTARANDLVATYSGGMRRRLEIIRGLIHKPEILFLDEPSIGLDPQSRRVVWDFLRDLMKESSMTIFLTTHYMDEAEALCTRLAIIDSGKIIASGTPEDLKSRIPGNDIVSITVDNPSEKLVTLVKKLTFVHKVDSENKVLRAYVDNGAMKLPTLLDVIRKSGSKVLSATIHDQSLEDVFIHFTGRSIRPEETKKVNFLVGAGAPKQIK
jgi:ABC-2 type transport system ATP-binding protein